MIATHAWIGIYDGIVRAIAVDFGDIDTADFVAGLVMDGAEILRVPLKDTKETILQSWPPMVMKVQP